MDCELHDPRLATSLFFEEFTLYAPLNAYELHDQLTLPVPSNARIEIATLSIFGDLCVQFAYVLVRTVYVQALAIDQISRTNEGEHETINLFRSAAEVTVNDQIATQNCLRTSIVPLLRSSFVFGIQSSTI